MNDRTKVRLAKSEGFLYDTRTGSKVLEFGFNETGELLNEADADQIMASVNKDAPRGNADPNLLILTEDELNFLEKNAIGKNLWSATDALQSVIASHRSLLSANAELSFELMLRKKYEGFLRTVVRSGETLEDEHDFEWFKEHSAIFHNKGAFK